MKKKWLEFFEERDTGKTKVFLVRSKVDGCELGFVKWYANWRQYVYEPVDNCVWNSDCLIELSAFIKVLMLDRKLEVD